MHCRKLSNSDWKPTEENVENKSSSWKGRFLSLGGRLVLLNSCLSNVPAYMLSLFPIPRGVLKRIDFFRARLLWQEEENVKYHLVNWPVICQPRDQGGLGVTDISIKNICVLCKWLWKLETSDGIWQQLIRNKYLRTKSIHEFNVKAAKSQFWAGLIHIREIFYRYCRKEVRNGKNTCLWEDWWVGDSPLKVTYSRLYNLTDRNFITVETVRK